MKHNLIGISGKIGSGKDTVGQMIQYHFAIQHARDFNVPEDRIQPFETYDKQALETYGRFSTKKFGGKLKQIAGLMIGCTEEDFEDREFKEKELGEEWWFYVSSLFPGGKMYPYMNASEETHNNIELYLIKLTPRKILQLLGTECGRQIIHPNIWINALFADYKDKNEQLPTLVSEFPNWVITDMRFPNELEAVKAKGGLTIRVNLVGNDDTGTHESETALDNSSFDVTINAEFGLDNLLKAVEQIMPLIL